MPLRPLMSPYHCSTMDVPSPYHRRTNSTASSDFVTKSEHEAAQVGLCYGDGTEENRGCLR